MMRRIQQDRLRRGINAALRRDGGIERHRDIQIELVLYLLRRIFIIIQDNDGKRHPVSVFLRQRFEKRNIETRAGTVGIEKVDEDGLVAGYGQLTAQLDRASGRYRMILCW